MATSQNHAGIFYARVNTANLTIAQSNSGGVVGGYSDVILAPSSITGPITSSTASASVTNAGTDFTNDMVNKFLWQFDINGNPILVGQILTVNSSSSITLTANASSTATARPFGVSYTLITTRESVIVGVPVTPQDSSSVWITDFTAWRQSPSNIATTYNEPTVSQLVRYSNAGTPLVIDSTPDNVAFTIEPLQVFQAGIGSGTYWQDAASLPTTNTALLNPFGGTGIMLSALTMYRWRTEELLASELVSPGTNASFVRNLGYK
jgi:hypothetical protein